MSNKKSKRRITTLLKNFIDLENEIYENYNEKEIVDGFEKLEKKGVHVSVSSLAYQLWIGAEDYVKLDEEFPDND